MRKMMLMVFGILLSVFSIYAQVNIEFDQNFKYETNCFNISENEITDFEDGNTDFKFIETLDDFIYNPSLEIGYKFKFGKFSIKPAIKFSKDYYMNNSDKNDYSIYGSLNNDLTFMNVNLAYGSSLDNYAREYFDHDGSNQFEKYTYDKNMYKVYMYKRIKNFVPVAYIKYEEFFYNEYFTEHDGNALTMSIGNKFIFKNSYLKLFYNYKIFETDNHNDFALDEFLAEDVYYRDGSYESNKYSIELETKKIRFSKRKSIRPRISFDYEQSFYSTDAPVSLDPIHSTRQDDISDVKLGCNFYLFKYLDFDLEFRHKIRVTKSDWKGLDDIKNYTDDTIKFNIQYKF